MRARAPLVVLALALAVVPFLLRFPLLRSRGFNPDELEHLHFSWCVAQGKVPYVDYFDHHTPWLHLALARIVARHDTASSEDEAVEALFAARRAMLPWAALTLVLTAVVSSRGPCLVPGRLPPGAGRPRARRAGPPDPWRGSRRSA